MSGYCKFAAILIAVATLCSACINRAVPDSYPEETTNADTSIPESLGPIYSIEGNEFHLKDGEHIGKEGTISLVDKVTGDLNADGYDDQAVILRFDSVGSGVFYYLNALMNDGHGNLAYVGGEFLGDRINFDFLRIYGEGNLVPHTDIPIRQIDYGNIVVAYFLHEKRQAFTEDPRLYITQHWKVVGGKLILLEQNQDGN